MLQAGVHFGHLKRKWNPHMAPYIFTEKKGIHIIDLHKTGVKLDEAASAMKQIAKSGKFYKGGWHENRSELRRRLNQ